MTKQPQTSTPDAAIKRAFTRWMHGTPWTALKRQLKRPLQRAFTTLAHATTWKQARAQRDKTVKQQDRKRGAA